MLTKMMKPVYARLGRQQQLKTDKAPKAMLHMQRWASENHTFQAEAQRFVEYISNPQIQCEKLKSPGALKGSSQDWAWKVCQDTGHQVKCGNRKCIVYSFGPVIYQGRIEIDLARQGYEVHVFDPSSKTSIHAPDLKNIHTHSVTLDWRESLVKLSRPSRPSAKTRQSRRLTTIMKELGHEQVDIVRADLQSSEWKVLENIIADGSINRVGQIVFTAHLHWSGFEVRGSNPEVIRYWYSVLKAVEAAGFKLFNSFQDNKAPNIVLGQNFQNTSCCFTLGWVKVDKR
ncbi:probable methyltransferase-like protein 24 isoform X2 [Antedon mediterranea]